MKLLFDNSYSHYGSLIPGDEFQMNLPSWWSSVLSSLVKTLLPVLRSQNIPCLCQNWDKGFELDWLMHDAAGGI